MLKGSFGGLEGADKGKEYPQTHKGYSTPQVGFVWMRHNWHMSGELFSSAPSLPALLGAGKRDR